MAPPRRRVRVPIATKGAIIEVRTLVNHPMDSGLRRDHSGRLVPRRIIDRLEVLLDGELVFAADLHPAVSANPYLAFRLRAQRSGTLEFRWREEGGAVFTATAPLRVT